MPLNEPSAEGAHIDGEPGFYLAVDRGDAEFFAARRPEGGLVVTYEMDDHAWDMLEEGGATRQGIPGGRPPFFVDDEIFVPIDLFLLFNELLEQGEIHVRL